MKYLAVGIGVFLLFGSQQRLAAQSAPETEPRRGGARPDDDAGALLPFVFEGFVLDPDGAPAEGAVVVSSAGGKAIVDGRGVFRLEVQVPLDAESVEFTAVGRGGRSLLASSNVGVSAAPGFAQVGRLSLAQGGSCSPSWVPSFGGQPGTNVSVNAMTVYDDGGGPALYAGGASRTRSAWRRTGSPAGTARAARRSGAGWTFSSV